MSPRHLSRAWIGVAALLCWVGRADAQSVCANPGSAPICETTATAGIVVTRQAGTSGCSGSQTCIFGAVCDPSVDTFDLTHKSDDVRQCLVEGELPGTGAYRLEYNWTFPLIPAGWQCLVYEGYRTEEAPEGQVEDFSLHYCMCVPNPTTGLCAPDDCTSGLFVQPLSEQPARIDQGIESGQLRLVHSQQTTAPREFHIQIHDVGVSGDAYFNVVRLDHLRIRTIMDPSTDADADGWAEECDNCPGLYNSSQSDPDEDGVGDECDNCPNAANSGQENTDGDPFGNACDACPADPNNDIDHDGVCHPPDNCPNKVNPNQLDEDEDGIGDACDPCVDPDNDGYGTDLGQPMMCVVDNCPNVANPTQTNSDGDVFGDACDNCPLVTNGNQQDSDSDGIGNACDPCFNNGICQPGETCFNCADCPSGFASIDACGNGVCETADGEDCTNCPDDCNGKLNGPAGGRFCCSDGAGVPHPVTCTDARCTGQGNTCLSTPATSFYCCGTDGCQAGETCSTCALDCSC